MKRFIKKTYYKRKIQKFKIKYLILVVLLVMLHLMQKLQRLKIEYLILVDWSQRLITT